MPLVEVSIGHLDAGLKAMELGPPMPGGVHGGGAAATHRWCPPPHQPRSHLRTLRTIS